MHARAVQAAASRAFMLPAPLPASGGKDYIVGARRPGGAVGGMRDGCLAADSELPGLVRRYLAAACLVAAGWLGRRRPPRR